MKEFELIDYISRYFAEHGKQKGLIVPIGDDCSVIRPEKGFDMVTTADSLIDGNHFTLKYFTPREIGRKALRVNLSDLASMGAAGPYYAWISFSMPEKMKDSIIKGVIAGIKEDCKRYGVTLAGGNITGASDFSIHVTLTGWVKPKTMLKRSGAKKGDRIYVTGTIGPSTLAYKQFKKGEKPEKALLKRWANPKPKIEIGKFLSQKNVASSCIDISDGIFQDLGHLLNASGVGAQVEWKLLPIDHALKKKNPTVGMIGFGEDYELLFTVPKRNLKKLSPIEKEITRIGEISSRGLIVLDKSGNEMNITNVGYSHFT